MSNQAPEPGVRDEPDHTTGPGSQTPLVPLGKRSRIVAAVWLLGVVVVYLAVRELGVSVVS